MNKQLRKKLSTALVAVMFLSMLMPVLSYAASYIGFHYNDITGKLYGEIYTSDPDNVTVERVDASGTVEDMNGIVSQYLYQYDDNNVLYKSISYRLDLATDTTKEIKVTEGIDKQVFIINKSETNKYNSYYNDTVTLDVYRMKGTEHLSEKLGGSFLKSEDKLFTFIPEESGHDGIQIQIPRDHNNDGKNVFNPNIITASDFVLRDVSVNQSVYASEVHTFSNQKNQQGESVYDQNRLILKFPDSLIKGNKYELILSGTSSGNEIQLPKADSNYFTEVKYGDINSYTDNTGEIVHYLISKNVIKFKNISFEAAPTDPTPGGSVGGGGALVDPNKDKQVVTTDSLKNGKDGIVTVAISKEKPQVLLPIKASEAVGNNKLQLKSDGLTVEIPTKVLAKLQGILPADQLEGAQISFDFKNVSVSDSTYLLNKAKTQSNADVKAAGDIYDFSLAVVSKDGKITTVSQFDEPITISLKVSANSNKSLIGVYYIADNGKLEYVGGKLVGDEIKADIRHFSKYAILEYNKSFSDVTADYWASDIIKEMAAKHIVQGVSTDLFAPQADVTRAEFAALLARALGLKATGSSGFTDVNASAWYAEAVAAVNQAGIVNGKDATTFAPNAKITREEMSALLVRAYEYKTGSKLDAGVEAKFVDRSEAADWALASIDAAYKAGFIEGRVDNKFAPKAQLTRAESTKAIYTLLVK